MVSAGHCHSPAPFVSEVNCTVDVIFVIDSSDMVSDLQWHVVKQFVVDLIEGLNVDGSGSRMGVIVYSETGHLVFDISAYDDVANMPTIVWDLEHLGGQTFFTPYLYVF